MALSLLDAVSHAVVHEDGSMMKMSDAMPPTDDHVNAVEDRMRTTGRRGYLASIHGPMSLGTAKQLRPMNNPTKSFDDTYGGVMEKSGGAHGAGRSNSSVFNN